MVSDLCFKKKKVFKNLLVFFLITFPIRSQPVICVLSSIKLSVTRFSSSLQPVLLGEAGGPLLRDEPTQHLSCRVHRPSPFATGSKVISPLALESAASRPKALSPQNGSGQILSEMPARWSNRGVCAREVKDGTKQLKSTGETSQVNAGLLPPCRSRKIHRQLRERENLPSNLPCSVRGGD